MVTATTSMSTRDRGGDQEGPVEAGRQRVLVGRPQPAAAAGAAARTAAAAWARALSATTVQATVPSTARPMEPPT